MKLNLYDIDSTLRRELFNLQAALVQEPRDFDFDCYLLTNSDRLSDFIDKNAGRNSSIYLDVLDIDNRFIIRLSSLKKDYYINSYGNKLFSYVYDKQKEEYVPSTDLQIDTFTSDLKGLTQKVIIRCLQNPEVLKQSAENIAENLRYVSITLNEDYRDMYDSEKLAVFLGNKFSIIEMVDYWSIYPNGRPIFTIYEDKNHQKELASVNLIKLDKEANRRGLIQKAIKVYPNAIGVIAYDNTKLTNLTATDIGVNTGDKLALKDIIFSLLQFILSQPRVDLEFVDNLKKQLECLDYTMSKLNTTHPALLVFKEAWDASQQVLKEVTSVKNDTLTIQKESKENSIQTPGNMDLFRE